MEHRPMQAAPDYTTAALVMILVNLLWILVTLWALWGWGPVLLLTALLNHLISCRARGRMRQRGRT